MKTLTHPALHTNVWAIHESPLPGNDKLRLHDNEKMHHTYFLIPEDL
jgi:hypothetical protein